MTTEIMTIEREAPMTGSMTAERKGPGGRHENMRKYDPEEAQRVHELVAEFFPQWTLIAKMLTQEFRVHRSPASVRNYYKRFMMSKAMEQRGEAKNRCQLCNQIKRGHICTQTNLAIPTTKTFRLAVPGEAALPPLAPAALAGTYEYSDSPINAAGLFLGLETPTPRETAPPSAITANATPTLAHQSHATYYFEEASQLLGLAPPPTAMEVTPAPAVAPTVVLPTVVAPTVVPPAVAPTVSPTAPLTSPPPEIVVVEPPAPKANHSATSPASLLPLSSSPRPAVGLPSPEDAAIPA